MQSIHLCGGRLQITGCFCGLLTCMLLQHLLIMFDYGQNSSIGRQNQLIDCEALIQFGILLQEGNFNIVSESKCTTVGRLHACQNTQKGGFPGPVPGNYSRFISPRQSKGNAFEQLLLTKGF